MKKILVVDDDVGVLEMVQIALEGEGYRVSHRGKATSG